MTRVSRAHRRRPTWPRRPSCCARPRVTFGRGDASTAHAKLRRHAERFPRGELVDVRMALEVRVLCALDRSGDAKTLARRFLARYPGSALAGQVKGSCAGS